MKRQVAQTIFVIGLAIFSLGVTRHYRHLSSTTVITGLTERNLAIEDALKKGEKTYSYTTHFIPGIGYITDKDSYLKSLAPDQASKN